MIKEDEDLLAEMRENLDYCYEQEGTNKQEMLDDLRFSNPANCEQWDQQTVTARNSGPGGPRPCLVLDQTNQFIKQVVNDARMNKPSIHVHPVNDEANVKTANILQGLVKHIELSSKADHAYDTAIEYSARCGLGWFRVIFEPTRYDPDIYDISIKRVLDIFSVHLDPDAQEPDGCDATYGFVEENIPRKTFRRRYPKAKEPPEDSYHVSGTWSSKDTVRVVEYFKVEESDQPETSELPNAEGYKPSIDMMEQEVQPEVPTISLPKKTKKVMWYKCTSNEILERTEFPSSYIPLIPVYGHELFIEGKRYLSGMIRNMKDPQRIYNAERTSYTEMVLLAPKAPYILDPRQIAGYEKYWAQANTANFSYLPVHTNVGNEQLGFPQRQPGPDIPTAFLQGAQIAQGDIQASIGMYAANVGKTSNEISGVAILARQHKGDSSNFHFIDNLARAIRHLGTIILEMIPVIYDTQRIVRIVGEDGQEKMAQITPGQQEPYVAGPQMPSINPEMGVYDVTVTSGPSFESRRQEAATAMLEMTNSNPQIFNIIGDMMIRSMDWPHANEIANRLHALLPPQVLAADMASSDDNPIIAQMKQAIQGMQKQIAQLNAALADKSEAEAGSHLYSLSKLELQREEQRINALVEAAKLEISQKEIAVKEREIKLKEIEFGKTVTDGFVEQERIESDTALNRLQTGIVQSTADKTPQPSAIDQLALMDQLRNGKPPPNVVPGASDNVAVPPVVPQ